jgi:hypothetical protein
MKSGAYLSVMCFTDTTQIHCSMEYQVPPNSSFSIAFYMANP